MSANGWRVADSDMHVMEPPDLWDALHRPGVAPHGADRAQRAPPRHAGPGQEPQPDAHRAWPSPTSRRRSGGSPDRTRRLAPSESRLAGMPRRSSRPWTRRASTSRCCSRAAGCSSSGSTPPTRSAPTGSNPSSRRRSPAPTTTGARLLPRQPDRLLGAGLLAPHDVDAAVDETRRCVDELGFKTVIHAARAASIGGRGTIPRTTRSGESASGSACRSASTAAARTTSARLRARVFDTMMMWHTFGQPLGIMAVTVSLTARRRAPAVPQSARRSARRQLRLGAVVAASPRRALGVGRATRSARSRPMRRRSTSARTAS